MADPANARPMLHIQQPGNMDFQAKPITPAWKSWKESVELYLRLAIPGPDAENVAYKRDTLLYLLGAEGRKICKTLAFDKVEFRIDERNQKSRKAVEKLNAKLEGILRKDTLMNDGFMRSTCCYGILKEEWSNIKTTIFNSY